MHCTDDVYGRTQSDVASVLSVHVTHFAHKFFDALGDASHGETGFTVSTDGEPVLAHSSHLVDYMKYIRKARDPERPSSTERTVLR